MTNNITQKELNLMSCQEVADMLKLKVKTIYSYINYKQIPDNLYRKIGRKPTFIYDEVVKWYLAGAELKPRPK